MILIMAVGFSIPAEAGVRIVSVSKNIIDAPDMRVSYYSEINAGRIDVDIYFDRNNPVVISWPGSYRIIQGVCENGYGSLYDKETGRAITVPYGTPSVTYSARPPEGSIWIVTVFLEWD